jgi:hypothetical protein
MIFEVTRDYAIIIPLMISSLISFFISQRLQPQAIYEAAVWHPSQWKGSPHTTVAIGVAILRQFQSTGAIRRFCNLMISQL